MLSIHSTTVVSLFPGLAGEGTAECRETQRAWCLPQTIEYILRQIFACRQGLCSSCLFLPTNLPCQPLPVRTKGIEPCGAVLGFMLSAGIPLSLELRLFRQWMQVPICFNLEIFKFPQFMLYLFWKIQMMCRDIWRPLARIF